MKNQLLSAFIFLSTSLLGIAQTNTHQITSLDHEKWFGGLVALGNQMPFDKQSPKYDLETTNLNNQVVPLLISSKGRYIWSEQAFSFQMKNDNLVLTTTYPFEIQQAGKTLKEAYLAASKKHFPPSGAIPDPVFFAKPQYNTWIELMYNQNQDDILKYAHHVIENKFPTGVFMIDDNWQNYYGNYDFKKDKFPDAKAMITQLHQLGFQVMVWISPYLSADSPEFRDLESKGLLLKNSDGTTALIHWWNGYSACYDTSNPKTITYLKETLKNAQKKYGIDGFKFDGGDIGYMQAGTYKYFDPKANNHIFSQKWAELALDFPFNELRTTWKTGGQAIVQRLGDKEYSWKALSLLIPDMTTAGLLGFPYTCPDMIGGGSFAAFLNIKENEFDQELIVRSAQVHAMMPMMQFSVAPWRILNEKNKEICAKYAQWHEKLGPYILKYALQSAKTGEPIIRSMEYSFPNQGLIQCKDQFMLGDQYLVAPMTEKGTERTVILPKGKWIDDLGKTYQGGKTYKLNVPIDRLPYFMPKN